MTTIAVIPARFASTRFPGKPLARDTGKYLIQHVYERASAARRLDRVIVATDDERIVEAVHSFGGETCVTRADHVSGTDRVGEVAAKVGVSGSDIVLNVQGDEPEVSPSVLDEVVERLVIGAGNCRIATPAAPFAADGPREGTGSPLDPNCVKVVTDGCGRALYFSRSLIPYPRDRGGTVDDPARWLLHLGVYAFRGDALREVTDPRRVPPTTLEQRESLEQLRWLSAGLSIAVVLVQHRFAGIDTPEQYAAFVSRTRSGVAEAAVAR